MQLIEFIYIFAPRKQKNRETITSFILLTKFITYLMVVVPDKQGYANESYNEFEPVHIPLKDEFA